MRYQKLTYALKLPQQPELYQQLEQLKEIATQAHQRLLEEVWTEEWIERLGISEKKAYKELGEEQVDLLIQDQQIYLPSRIRRCITERVGRILRSQAKRRVCYYDLVRLIQVTGVEGNLDSLVKVIANSLIRLEGKYYRRAIIRQFLRTFRRFYYKLGLDIAVFLYIPYSTLVKPTIRSFSFPFAPDDNHAIRFTWESNTITVALKLPRVSQPQGLQHWCWKSFHLVIPDKIHPNIALSRLGELLQALGVEIAE